MTSLIYSVNVDWLSDFSKVEPHRWSRTKLPCGLCQVMHCSLALRLLSHSAAVLMDTAWKVWPLGSP